MFDQSTLLEQLGNSYTNKVVERFQKFAYIPDIQITKLAKEALNEHWGKDNYALEKYLAVHFAWSIGQRKYTHSENQLYVSAGHLQTRYGTPLYMVFAQNTGGSIPWKLVTTGSQISATGITNST